MTDLRQPNFYLVFINYKGKDFSGKHTYEFCYADSTELDQENLVGWDSMPAMGLPKAPIDNLTQVCEIEIDFRLDLIQNSTTMSIWDSIEGVIAMGYENISDYVNIPQRRLYFKFGETKKQTLEMLYSREIEFTKTKILS